MEDPLMEVRTSLTTTTNVTGGLGSANWGAVEIQKKIHHSESQLKGLVPTEASQIVHALTVSAKSAFK